MPGLNVENISFVRIVFFKMTVKQTLNSILGEFIKGGTYNSIEHYNLSIQERLNKLKNFMIYTIEHDNPLRVLIDEHIEAITEKITTNKTITISKADLGKKDDPLTVAKIHGLVMGLRFLKDCETYAPELLEREITDL